jgi:hypothetical protein
MHAFPFAAAFAACQSTDTVEKPTEEQEQEQDQENADSGSPLEHLFTFAVIADPHINGSEEHSLRLEHTVAWINELHEAESIELVLVLGDVGWGEGLVLSKELLDGLDVPHVPVIGDNEVSYGSEFDFDSVYSESFAVLEESFSDWSTGSGPVWNPEEEKESHFYNYAFSHHGIRFVCMDWAARAEGGLDSEMGDLHDFEGGTLPWFEEESQSWGSRLSESVVIATHVPMMMSPGAMDMSEQSTLTDIVSAQGNSVYANFAGHFHLDSEVPIEDGGYDVYILDAVWDDALTLRMVQVWSDGENVSYEQELMVLPW